MRSRLGDDIDDFCVKCKRVMNHLVVSLVNDEPAKVRCRTCHGDHDFRHEQAPPPKLDARKAALIQSALEKASAAAAAGATAGTPDDDANPAGEVVAGETMSSDVIAVLAQDSVGKATPDLPNTPLTLPLPAPARTSARKGARAK